MPGAGPVPKDLGWTSLSHRQSKKRCPAHTEKLINRRNLTLCCQSKEARPAEKKQVNEGEMVRRWTASWEQASKRLSCQDVVRPDPGAPSRDVFGGDTRTRVQAGRAR